jgi:hypothetical protein
MAEDYYSAAPHRPAGPSLRAIFALVTLAFLGGALLIGWLVWDGRIDLSGKAAAPQPVANSTFAALPTPSPSTVASQAAATAGFEGRVAALEARLARLDLEAAAAEGNTARAEAMMVAFAARRAIERGVPLGFLSEQLKLRFGDAQPAAVATVLDAAKGPVTLDKLAGDLDALGPALAQAPKDEGGWDSFTRELSSLFVIRRDSAASTNAEDRFERARLMLRTGQTNAAIAEVERLPGSSSAASWIGLARRYAEAQRALEQLETAALLEPERLRDSGGGALLAPSPATVTPATAQANPPTSPALRP